MRLIVIFLIVGAIIYGAYHTLTTRQGIFSTFLSSKADTWMQNPVKMVAPDIGSTIPKSTPPPPSPVPSIVPGRVGEPIVDTKAIFHTGEAPLQTPSVPATVQPVPVFVVTKSYTFSYRPIPPTESLTSFAGLGVTVITDVQSRTIMVRGPVDAVTAIMDFLHALDTVQGSCAVQTWAVFVDRKAQVGFDLVAALSATTGLPYASTLGGGSFTLDLSADKVAMALNVIADGSSVEVVQRPHVRLTHGVQARIESIQEVPVPTTSVSQGLAQTSIDYRKVGLQLQVLPTFLGSDRVRLQVTQTNGLIGQNVTIGNNEVPIISSQTVETAAELSVGQTIVLGGVSTQRTRRARGLLRNVTETDEGALYVILSTYHDEPRAIPVSDPHLESPDGNTPLTETIQPAPDWIDGQVLPPLLRKKNPVMLENNRK